MITKEILTYKPEIDEVQITEQAKEGNICFKKLYASDKKPHKPLWKAALRAIYYVHAWNSVLPTSTLSIDEKIELCDTEFLNNTGYTYNKLMSNPKIKDCLDRYLFLTERREVRSIKLLMNKFNDLINIIEETPIVTTHKGWRTMENPQTGDVEKIEIEYEEINHAKFIEYTNLALKLTEYYKKLEAIIEHEQKATEKNNRLFESEKVLPNINNYKYDLNGDE